MNLVSNFTQICHEMIHLKRISFMPEIVRIDKE